jgi:acetolactate synthase-1/2/3 large subunit
VLANGSSGRRAAVGELETTVRYKVPLLIIVFANASYGWIKASQRASYGQRYFSLGFSRTGHARIAAEYGVKSWKVEDLEAIRGY